MHGQLTLHDAPGTPARAVPPRHEPDGPALRYGFTYRYTEALAWQAVRYHTPPRGMNTEDRFEAAWGAIAECLYAAAEPPSALGLFKAGLVGLDRLRRGGLHERGCFRQNRDGSDPGAWTVPAGSFYRYWTRPALLGAHGVTRHRVTVDGDERKRVGYCAEDVTSALARQAAATVPALSLDGLPVAASGAASSPAGGLKKRRA